MHNAIYISLSNIVLLYQKMPFSSYKTIIGFGINTRIIYVVHNIKVHSFIGKLLHITVGLNLVKTASPDTFTRCKQASKILQANHDVKIFILKGKKLVF